MTIQVDVLISGAGPVGLFFAYQLAMRGHSIYICDPKPGPTDQSRALVVTSRTMEVLEARGLADEVLSEAFISSGIRIFRLGQVIAQVDACGDTPFPHVTALPQGKTEAIINARLESETQYKVNWKTELVSYTQNESGVTSTVRDRETKEDRVVESKYIIGADGSHSMVRKGTEGWLYEGTTVKTKFALADLTIHGDNIENMKDRMNSFMKGSNVMGMLPIMPPDSKGKQNVFRIFWNLESYNQLGAAEKITHGLSANEPPPSIEFIQEWVDKMTYPLKFEVSDLLWSSYFKINERIANGYRRNRAFVMGDAAHCHSPAGGQGMNLGLQDADNLAWKLSEVLKGTVKDPEALLDSYEAERVPHAKHTIETTGNATRAGITDSSVYNYIRSAILSTALAIPQIRQYSFKTFMQHNVTVDPKVSTIMGTSDKGLVNVGDFLPDATAVKKSYITSRGREKSIQQKTLREIVSESNKYTVILVATCPSSVLPNTPVVEQFWKLTESYTPIKSLVVQSVYHNHFMRQLPSYITDAQAAEDSFYSEIRMDSPFSVTQRIGLYSYITSIFGSSSALSPCALVVVRPDLYVAHAKIVNNVEELNESFKFVSSIFV